MPLIKPTESANYVLKDVNSVQIISPSKYGDNCSVGYFLFREDKQSDDLFKDQRLGKIGNYYYRGATFSPYAGGDNPCFIGLSEQQTALVLEEQKQVYESLSESTKKIQAI